MTNKINSLSDGLLVLFKHFGSIRFDSAKTVIKHSTNTKSNYV